MSDNAVGVVWKLPVTVGRMNDIDDDRLERIFQVFHALLAEDQANVPLDGPIGKH